MTVKLAFFFMSILLFSGLIYISCGIWFKNKRTAQLRLFFTLGLMHSFWALFNGISILLPQELFEKIYPVYFTIVCFLPTVFLWYILYFTESKFVHKKWTAIILAVYPVFDFLLLWTNPWHKRLISGYDGLLPIGGDLFTLHVLLGYTPLFIGLILLTKYIIKNAVKIPALLYVGTGVFLMVISNILYTFGYLNIGFDITPISFIIMFGSFALYSVQLRLFDLKTVAMTSYLDSLSDALLFVNNAGIVTDINPSFQDLFPDMIIIPNKTHIRDVGSFIKSKSKEWNLDIIFSETVPNKTDKKFTEETAVLINEKWHNFLIVKDIINERGQYAGYIVTFTDVSRYRHTIDEISLQNIKLTEQKNIELAASKEQLELALKEARSANSAKSSFLSNMSHEIRTPLNAIIGMTNIGKSSGSADRMMYSFNKIEEASRHLMGVINDILDMSKIEANKLELSSADFNFENILEHVMTVIGFRLEEKRQNFKVNIDPAIPKNLFGDDQRLEQVIINLLSNAHKFTPQHGFISLDAQLLDETENICTIQFTIKDTGIGINPDKIAHLFDSFNQAESDTTRKFGGTGLGLSISKSIVEMMGGDITAESKPGEGSIFSFTVKMKRSKTDFSKMNQLNVNEDKAKINAMFKDQRILLVEDIEINREIVLALLEPTLAEIDCAENGIVAVRMFEKSPQRYDLILMDVQMPEMDGYQTTRAIRVINAPNAAKIPIIAMTANVFREDVEKCLEAGMNDHIGKPINQDEMLEKLRGFI